MSRWGFGYANRQTVDPPIVKTAVLCFLAPMLAGAILWVSVSTIPDAATLIWLMVAYRPVTTDVLEHDNERLTIPDIHKRDIEESIWRPRIRLRYSVGDRVIEAWSHEPFGLWMSEAQFARNIAGFSVGDRSTCWYDASNPESVVLSRDIPWSVVGSMTVPPLTLAVTGGLMWMAWPLMFYRKRQKQYRSPKDWKES
jgi:Protein of unknown function (DUF3592)